MNIDPDLAGLVQGWLIILIVACGMAAIYELVQWLGEHDDTTHRRG